MNEKEWFSLFQVNSEELNLDEISSRRMTLDQDGWTGVKIVATYALNTRVPNFINNTVGCERSQKS